MERSGAGEPPTFSRQPVDGWTSKLKCCRKSIPMMGIDTPANKKFHVYVLLKNLTENCLSPQHGMAAPEGPEMEGPEVGAEDR